MKVDYLCNSWQYLLQQLVFLTGKGYYKYHCGLIPEGKEHKAINIDKKIINKYNINLSKDQRYRRKKKKLSNFYYLRWKNQFFILQTDGELDVEIDDEFFDIRIKQKESNRLSVVVSENMKFNLSMRYKEKSKYSVTVSFSNETYKDLKAEIEELIQHKQTKKLENLFENLRGIPAWQGVIKQEYKLLEEVYRYAKKYNLNTKKKNIIKYPKEYPCLELYPLRINTYRVIYNSKYKNE